ncbi:MAG: AraC family transcriptional regulator [Lentisphaerae bacterium]|nr:MAG: AraC family transcriptional regulator [Lentisphaerota bacterium]
MAYFMDFSVYELLFFCLIRVNQMRSTDMTEHFRYVCFRMHHHEREWRGTEESRPYYIVAGVVSGRLRCTLPELNKEYRLMAGDILGIPPFCRRFFHGRAEVSIRLRIWTNGSCLFDRPMVRRSQWFGLEIMRLLELLSMGERQPVATLTGHHLVLSLLHALKEQDASEKWGGGDKLGRLSLLDIRQLVADNLQNGIRCEDLARESGLNQQYFSRLFVRMMGISPRRYIRDQRLRYAARLLLEERLCIKEVAYLAGYRDLSLFHRQFKAFFGVSPGQFRQRHEGGDLTG